MDYLGEKKYERLDKKWTGEEPSHFHQESIEKCFDMQKFAPKTKQKIKYKNQVVTKRCLNKWWI